MKKDRRSWREITWAGETERRKKRSRWREYLEGETCKAGTRGREL